MLFLAVPGKVSCGVQLLESGSSPIDSTCLRVGCWFSSWWTGNLFVEPSIGEKSYCSFFDFEISSFFTKSILPFLRLKWLSVIELKYFAGKVCPRWSPAPYSLLKKFSILTDSHQLSQSEVNTIKVY